jgi:hypothetical protein
MQKPDVLPNEFSFDSQPLAVHHFHDNYLTIAHNGAELSMYPSFASTW